MAMYSYAAKQASDGDLFSLSANMLWRQGSDHPGRWGNTAQSAQERRWYAGCIVRQWKIVRAIPYGSESIAKRQQLWTLAPSRT